MQFVDFTDKVKPCLVMEYLPLGNLQQQDKQIARISELEVVVMLRQLLDGLGYLHDGGVVYRDVKPANILVKSWGQQQEPSQFWVKLGDFGLAKDLSMLRTFCGTAVYLALEVAPDSCYTSMIDVWALGVVVFQYGYNLPRYHSQENWHQTLVQTVDDWDSDGLVDIISSSMLRVDPQQRRLARECLEMASKLQTTTPLNLDIKNSPTSTEKLVTPVMVNRSTQAWHRSGLKNDHVNQDKRQQPPATSAQQLDTLQKRRQITLASAGENLFFPQQVTWHNNQILEVFPGHLQIMIEGKLVVMRKADGWLNAAQILEVAGKNEVEQRQIFDLIKKHTKIEEGELMGAIAHGPPLWICHSYGQSLCEMLRLIDALKPLLDLGQDREESSHGKGGMVTKV